MSLSTLIRGKSDPAKFATATVATFATLEGERGRSVASVATVSVAKPEIGEPIRQQPTVPAHDDKKAIRAWLAHIGETHQPIIDEVLHMCATDPAALAYYTMRSMEGAQ